MNENLKLICLVLRHQQEIKLSFKSESRVFSMGVLKVINTH